MHRDPKSFLPLKPVELEVLLSLSEGDLHGYGLVQAIEARTDGVVRLEPGNLYRVIRRLLEDGLVVEAGRRPTGDGAERRRYYSITALGSRVLAEQIRLLTQLVNSPLAKSLVKGWAT